MQITYESMPDLLLPLADDYLHVSDILSEVGASDGEYLHHVVQTLLERHGNPYSIGVSLAVSHAVFGSVPESASRFAAAVQLVAVAGLAHRQTVAGATLIPAEDPSVDAHLVVLAGDYLYSQAAYITAGLQNLSVMATLADEIKVQCRREIARQPVYGASVGLFGLSAVGTALLLGCNDMLVNEFRAYGRTLDLLESSTLSASSDQPDSMSLLSSFNGRPERSRLLAFVETLAAGVHGAPPAMNARTEL
jgi:hypothetical protein